MTLHGGLLLANIEKKIELGIWVPIRTDDMMTRIHLGCNDQAMSR